MNSKIISREKAKKLSEKLKKQGLNVGLTNGVFDLIHSGHIDYLEKARKKCDVLFVSVNTDSSVKKLKGKNKPINSLKERQETLAGLKSIDYVLQHNETGMKKTIKLIKPTTYFKGGDYKISDLKSKETIEKYGGKVIIIPFKKGKSTTSIINKILEKYAIKQSKLKKEKKKIIFLDRDGTINKQIEYLHEPEKFEFLPNALKGIKKMQKKGFEIIIVTNQQGIGLGYYTKEDFFKVNKKMLSKMSEEKIKILGIYYCPHTLADKCDCRKPKTGLIKKAVKEHNIDLKQSYFIGDSEIDVETGKNSGLKTILISNKKKVKTKADFVVKNLLEASKKIK